MIVFSQLMRITQRITFWGKVHFAQDKKKYVLSAPPLDAETR